MRRLAAAALLALAALARPARGDAPLWGRRIAALRFDGDAPADGRALAALTDLKPGQTLTEAAVRAALRNLFATRRFADLSVEAAPEGAGVAVRVRFAAAPRIASVAIVGRSLPDRRKLRDAAGLETGETWSADRGEAAVEGIRRVLRERGYFEPSVESRVEAGPDETSVAVSFRVGTGPLARTARPLYAGSTEPFAPAELEKRARLKEGTPFRLSRAREDAERLTAWLHGKGHARAEVRFEGERYDAAARSAEARYAVFVGPKVELAVTGASVASVRNHAESPWTRGEPPDEEAVRRLRLALVRDYQEKGYARVEVEATLRTEPGLDRVTVVIRKGARFAVAKVAFAGVRGVREKDLFAIFRTKPRGFLNAGRLVDKDLEEDRRTVEAVYAANGYLDTKAARPLVTEGKRPFTLDVAFPVDEGPLILVGDRRLEGNLHAAPEALAPLLATVPGQPYAKTRVSADEAAIQAWYLSHGFPDARVASDVRLEPAVPPRPRAVTVVYRVFEGDQVFFGKTIVRGNTRTRAAVIESEFAHDEGEPFSLGRLIETQQALTRLGVFSRIDLTFFPTDPESRTRTVLVSLAEAKPWTLLYGFGAEYDPHADRRFNLRLSLGVTYGNLFGRALSASVDGRYSARDKRIVASLRDPDFLGAKLPLSLTVFRADQVFGSYDVARRGTFLETAHRFSGPLKAAIRYQYEIVHPTADPAILSSLERQNQAIAISSIGSGVTWDARNDPVDPRSGLLASADVKYAFSFLDANARFLKALLQAALYRPYAGTVVALSVRAGAIQSYGTCDPVANPGCPPNLEIPIVERFFAGGRTSHRAFPLDDLGIDGQTTTPDPTGKPIGYGGNGLLLGNIEWRIPVAGDFGMSLFLDTGNVWADYRKIRLSELRTGVGLGLHYLTPVGPLRLEYGWKLDRKTGESAGEASFSVGYPF